MRKPWEARIFKLSLGKDDLACFTLATKVSDNSIVRRTVLVLAKQGHFGGRTLDGLKERTLPNTEDDKDGWDVAPPPRGAGLYGGGRRSTAAVSSVATVEVIDVLPSRQSSSVAALDMIIAILDVDVVVFFMVPRFSPFLLQGVSE